MKRRYYISIYYDNFDATTQGEIFTANDYNGDAEAIQIKNSLQDSLTKAGFQVTVHLYKVQE